MRVKYCKNCGKAYGLKASYCPTCEDSFFEFEVINKKGKLIRVDETSTISCPCCKNFLMIDKTSKALINSYNESYFQSLLKQSSFLKSDEMLECPLCGNEVTKKDIDFLIKEKNEAKEKTKKLNANTKAISGAYADEYRTDNISHHTIYIRENPGNFVAGFLLTFLLGIIGLIIAYATSKEDTIRGAKVGLIIFFVLAIIVIIVVFFNFLIHKF